MMHGDQIVQFDTKGNGGNDLDLDAIEFRDDSFYLDDENIIIAPTFGDGYYRCLCSSHQTEETCIQLGMILTQFIIIDYQLHGI